MNTERALSPNEIRSLFESVGAVHRGYAATYGDKCILALARRDDDHAVVMAENAARFARIALAVEDCGGTWSPCVQTMVANYLNRYVEHMRPVREP